MVFLLKIYIFRNNVVGPRERERERDIATDGERVYRVSLACSLHDLLQTLTEENKKRKI